VIQYLDAVELWFVSDATPQLADSCPSSVG